MAHRVKPEDEADFPHLEDWLEPIGTGPDRQLPWGPGVQVLFRVQIF